MKHSVKFYTLYYSESVVRFSSFVEKGNNSDKEGNFSKDYNLYSKENVLKHLLPLIDYNIFI